uniref:Uncharacterized protein n=1 Tax=Phaeomonas parva TaxID=124430 RepID=A0A7S1XTY5_9STRA|mmetsp:Transcript_36974/g.115817  ORF Transcript_36974/g.115817 Transcript_36974/m.115817 type:complete len:858 (+) Transcript_36974:456-3029(+)|eukprot:CAMPEP_0118885222 /NCGR_PEP_ID=MMETSP1163-20130328/23786_1 /TAXON_ID=124430 /ORGANISM="Phaeomonas parva, Strain CCMP2877" /LENGTH=857 /DNA_ID=CAMNT_0006823199 /DNA_START=440 /DNA_END=3013 /DNA_ORIENTATION=+
MEEAAHRYHTRDPIENLRVKVSLRQIFEPEHSDLPGERLKAGSKKKSKRPTSRNEVGQLYVKTFHWQEKKFGPHELIKYNAPNKPHNPTRAEQTYYSMFRRRNWQAKHSGEGTSEEDEALSSARLHGDVTAPDFRQAMLYTYTDGDSFVSPDAINKRSTTSISIHKSNISYAMTYLNQRTKGSSENASDTIPAQVQKLQAALDRQEPYKVMYIMAAVEVDPKEAEELLKKERAAKTTRPIIRRSTIQNLPGAGKLAGPSSEERRPYKALKAHHEVLCQIKLYTSGKMEVQPGFSEAQAESDDEGGGFVDDVALKTQLEQGPKLTTFRFQTAEGRIFEYAVENVNEVDNDDELINIEAHEREIEKKQTRSRQQARTRNITHPVVDEPRPLALQVQLEIVGADSFAQTNGRSLYVEYETVTPNHWRLEADVASYVKDTARARTRMRSQSAEDASADNVNAPLLSRADDTSSDEIVGVTHRVLPGTGYCFGAGFEQGHGLSFDKAISLSEANAGNMHMKQARGIGYAIILIVTMLMAILHEARNVFWLVYAFELIIALYMVDHMRSYSELDVSRIKDAAVYHFGHLLSFSMRGSENLRLKPGMIDVALPLHSPKIYFTVSQLSDLELHTVAGYAYCDVPQQAGTYYMKLNTWKPTDTLYSRMKDFFIGGADRLAHVSFAGRHVSGAAQATGGKLRSGARLSGGDPKDLPHYSRLGMVTESAGNLYVKMHVAERRPMEPKGQQSTRRKATKRSAREILNQYKKKARARASRDAHRRVDQEEGKVETSMGEDKEAVKSHVNIREQLALVRKRREELKAKYLATKERHDSPLRPPGESDAEDTRPRNNSPLRPPGESDVEKEN